MPNAFSGNVGCAFNSLCMESLERFKDVPLDIN